MSIAIIGAGASGMAAALQAAWRGGQVTLFERNPQVGRKLLVTGSGRCNITNGAAAAEKYACADPGWMAALLTCFGVSDLLSMLGEIGIPVYKTADDWYYPLSNSAQTVVDAFANALALAGVTPRTATQVTAIQSGPNGFRLGYRQGDEKKEAQFEKVVVAAGGAAYPALGSRGELFAILEQLGHTVSAKRPALAPVLAELGNLNPLQGVRLDAGVSLWDGNQRLAATVGNLIFTPWGLNGPAVMDLSHHISAHPERRLSLSLNLLGTCQEAFDTLLGQKRAAPYPLKVLLEAFFPPKVAPVYLKMAGLAENSRLSEVKEAALDRLVEKLKDTRLAVKGVRGFEYCQVSAGGVQVGEVNPLTMESRRKKGLYLTGETLDVVGPCGGYNLQYAFSSGALAGIAAAAP
jgi:predicted Rossmann fold flavoprotein